MDKIITWCPVCGKMTEHKKLEKPTKLLIFSGELVDGVPVQPAATGGEGCPYWKSHHCTIHQSDHHFEISPDFNDGQPVRRVPDNITHMSCRVPREGELVCCECLEAAEHGVTVMDLQKEFNDCDRRLIYVKASQKKLSRRYVVCEHKGKPERRFTESESDILRGAIKEPEKVVEHDDPVYCPECGTRLG